MRFIHEHYLILILGLLLTLLIEAPVLVFPFIAGKTYQGINIVPFGTDSHYYLSRGKEALEGHRLGNPFLHEGKDKQDYYFTFNERVLVAPARFLGLADKINIVTLYNIYNFIGVFILILLVYFFALQLSGNKLLAATAAVFSIGGYHMAYKQFFYNDFNFYARPMFPYVSSLGFFAYLNLLTLWLKTRKSIYKILSAVILGILFYVYVYAWTFALAFNGALFLLYLMKRDWVYAKSIIFVSGIGILIGLYNLIRMWILLRSNISGQFSYFMMSDYSRRPIFSLISAATLFLFLFFLYKKRSDQNIILIFGLIMAGWIALNQQIITGEIVQYAHYHWYFIVPLSIIAGLYMLWILLERYIWRNLLFAFMLLVLFFHSALGQYGSIFAHLDEREYEQSYQPIIKALQSDAKPGVILTADDHLAYLVTIYTNHDLFWHTSDAMAVTPFIRFTDALYVYMYLNKNARNDFHGYLHRAMENYADNSMYKGLYRFIEGFKSGLEYNDYIERAINNKSSIGLTRDKLISELAENYAKLGESGLNNLLRKYGVKYIVWDKNLYPEWDLSFIRGLEKISVSDNIYLYKTNY